MTEYKAKKSCADCGKMYDEDIMGCPRCKSESFYYIYMLPDNLFEEEVVEDHTFSFDLTLTSGP